MWTECMCCRDVMMIEVEAKSTFLAFNDSSAQRLLLRSACGFWFIYLTAINKAS